MARVNRWAFNGGELSDWLSPRLDLAKYHTGCERLQNAQVVRYGGARRRSGTLYVAAGKTSGKKVRLEGFDFGRTDSTIVEFGEQYLRFYRVGGSWGQIAVSGALSWIVSTDYDPGEVVLHNAVNYVALSAHTAAAGTEPGVGGSWATVWAALTGEIYEVPSPYLEADLFELQFVQRNDIILITHRDYHPRVLSRYGEAQWGLEELPWKSRPWQQLNDSATTLAPSATTGSITITASTDTFSAAWVGSRIRIVHFDEEQVFDRSSDWAWNPASYDSDYAAGDAMVTFNPLNTYDTTEPGATNPSRVWYDAAGTALDPAYRCVQNYTPVAWNVGGATYAVDDVVTRGGAAYVCIQAHTSAGIGTTDEPGAGATWEDFWDLVTAPTDAPNFFTQGVPVTGNITVEGQWEFETTGIWTGEWRIERSYDGGSNWETVKSMETEAASNFMTAGEEDPDNPALYRVLVTKTSTSGNTSRVSFKVLSREVAGEALVTSYTSPTQVDATVEEDFANTVATTEWSEDAYNPRHKYPSAATWHQKRLCLGGSLFDPQVVWMSQTGDYYNFREGTDDDEALQLALDSQAYEEISWMLSGRGLVVGTSSTEWLISTPEQAPITPSNVQAQPHTATGSANGKAVALQDAVVYVQRGGRKLIELVGNEFDGYRGRDLTVLAEHVTKGQVVQVARSDNLDTVLHVVTGAGELVGLVYDRAEEVAGWHRWDTDGTFESVATAYGHGEEDEVWVSVLRTIDGNSTRCIERFRPDQIRDEETPANQDDLCFVDCAAQYDGAATTAISGLDHLEGETVQVWADGADVGDFTVASGAITLEEAASKVTAGLGYTTVIRPMPFDENGTLGLRKSAVHLLVQFRYSLGAEAGDHVADRWSEIYFRRAADDDPDEAVPLKSEVVSVTIPNLSQRAKSVSVRQTRCVPMTVVAMMPEVELGDG